MSRFRGTSFRPGSGARFARRSALVALVLLAATTVTSAGCGDDGDRAVVDTGKVDWQLFGREPSRTHYLPAPESLNPPLKLLWSFNDRALIEFPPAVHDGVAYLANKYGNVRAIRLDDREALWDLRKDGRDVGPPTDVTAPVYYDGRVFVAFASGILVSLDARTGRVDWRRDLRSTLESSPVIVDDRLFIGTDKGFLHAIDSTDGRGIWKYRAPAPVKASPSVAGRKVVFGDYAGTMHALDAGSGDVVWRTATAGVSGGSGSFYSSPAIGFGKVFVGRDDGTVFAFDLASGRRAWAFGTRGSIYGSPAIARVPGTPPSVYIGSYDSNLYALAASNGRRLWSFRVGGPVPGTATVIGHTVYTSSFRTAESIGVDVRTQKKTFSFDSPGYTPMISDGRNLYLVGYFSLHAFEPRR